MLRSLDCKMRAEECRRLARAAPNPQMRAALADIERAWTRLAIETEIMERTRNRGRAPTAPRHQRALIQP